MENTPLDTIKQLLRITPQAQLLLEDNQILAASPEAQRLFPSVLSGYTAEQLFGIDIQDYYEFHQEGSLLFTATIGGNSYDISATALSPYYLCTVMPTENSENHSGMRSTAQQLRGSLSSIMAVAPKVLPLLGELDDPFSRSKAAVVSQGLYQLMRTTENLERYSSSQQPLQLQRFDLRTYFQQLEDQLYSLCQQASCTLDLQYPREICPCTADPVLLTQAIMNLLSNAMKFSRQDQPITLSCQKRKGRILISVRDHGQGIPPDQMASVFFRNERRGHIPDPRWGAGLGLQATRKIMDAHGGRMMLESIENQGTIVYLSLDDHSSSHGKLCAAAMPVVVPSGINAVLVGLSDVLPASVFDVIDIFA